MQFLKGGTLLYSARSTIDLLNAETDLLVFSMKASYRQKGFAFSEAKIWNEISYEAKQAPSLYPFKKILRNCR